MVILPVTDPVRRAVAKWLAEYAVDGPLVLAVSGGADSLALAAAVAAESAGEGAGQGRRVVAVTIDHGLQQGSARQAAACAEQLRQLGFPEVEVVAVTVGRVGGPEAAARTARYEALRRVATETLAGEPCPVLLGHTRDDQAETVLLGLSRGSGPRSIAGMRQWRAPWGRPLLTVSRSDTENACAVAGLAPWADPHNLDPTFTRVRLRTEVLPLLDRILGGGVAPALARTAELLADDLQALDQISERVLDEARDSDGSVSCAALSAHPAAVRRRVVRLWLAARGVAPLTAAHLYRLDALLSASQGTAVRLPGGTDVIRDRSRLSVQSSALRS